MSEEQPKDLKHFNITISFVEDQVEAEIHFENAVRCILNKTDI